MAVQAGRIQIIVMRDLIARLSGRQAPVDLSPFHVLAGTAFSCHVTHPTPPRTRLFASDPEFVRRNRGKIPEMGEQAATALGGDEGGKLEEAEESARSHSHSPGEER